MFKKPQLSVIIASYNSEKTIEDCLKSLENQKTDKNFEIIVVDSATDGTATFVEKKFPEVRLYSFSERKFCGDARNFGISVAKGKIIAFIDADCRADKNWVDKILKSHESPYPAIGGAIANGNPESYIGWAAYFCEFSLWMPRIHCMWMDDIAGANMSYKKNVFEKYGNFIEGTYCSDSDFHWRLRKDGFKLRFIPSILVSHYNIDNLWLFLRHEFFHGLCFARVRTQFQNFSRRKRLAFIIFSPFIPLRLLLKRGHNNIKNRTYLFRFVGASPLLVLGLICWSLGECIGYIGGKTNEKSS